MDRGKLQVYFGSGRGKTTAALGQAIREASGGKTVIIIQFLKGRQPEQISFIQRLEPEIKLFRFQRREAAFEELSPKEREEEIMSMKNGLSFAKKVLATGECDLLILDGILKLLGPGILKEEELEQLLDARDEADVILTGNLLPDWLRGKAQRVERIDSE